MKANVIKFSLAALLATTCASPLSAANFKAGDFDLSLGGSVRLDAGYQHSDTGDKLTGETEDDKLDFFCKLPTNNRLKFGAARDNLKGYVEVGFGSSELKTRHAYLTYTNGSHSLLVGQTDIPVLTEDPGQVLDDENDLCGYGDLDLSRRSQIKYTYTAGKLSLETAVSDNYVKNNPKYVGTGVSSASYRINESTPALAARLVYKNDRFTVAPSVYWQSFEYTGNKQAGDVAVKDVDAQTYIVGLDASLKFDLFKVATSAWYGQNPYLIASSDKRTASDLTYRLGQPVIAVDTAGASYATAEMQDVAAYGFWLTLSGDIGANTLKVGAGYESSEVETGLTDPAVKAQYRDRLSTRGAFVNLKMPVRSGFFIQPEVAYYDHGDDAKRDLRGTGKNDLGSEILAGVHFQYDF